MTDDLRDTKFLGFAKLLMKELLGDAGYIDVHHFWDSDEIAIYEEIIANRAYDLVYHSLYHNDAGYWPDLAQRAPDHYKRQITKATNEVPDLTEWPPTKEA